MDQAESGKISRRVVLGAVSAGALLVAAGCSDTSSATPSPGSGTSSSGTPTGGGSTTSGAPGTKASTAAPSVAGEPLVATKDVPVGGGVIVSGHEVVVTQPSSGTFVGLSSICTHQQCPVGSVTGGRIICPCHNSEFDLTGAVVQGPATQPLATKQIQASAGQVYLV